ncbi:MAG: alanine--glyoxylate aminotransferase family protein [Anaerolineales bacterium]|nr:alanine--glyoxylate aminotransferase family protein [Anaerolineales bacterium]
MTHLFVPGPVNVDPEVAAAQTKEMLPHRSAEFEALFRGAEAKLRKLFYTETRVFITASSGTGLHEAAVRNLAHNKVLSCVNGAFGKRWHDVALTNGKDVDLLTAEWDEPISPDEVAEAMQKEKYDIVTVVHNETSTGMMNPIKEIAAAVHAADPDTLVCVDAVSSLSGARIEMDAWGVDMLLTSSQKCLALPPGLGFAGVNDKAMARAAEVENRGWYFDLVRLENHRVKNSTPATPAISLIYALDVQLDRIFEEGLDNRFARHSAMAKKAQDWALAHDFEMFAPEGYRSQTVTTIKNTPEVNVAEMNAFLVERGMRIANGYGPLKNETFRIGHMGETTLADVDKLLEALEAYLG